VRETSFGNFAHTGEAFVSVQQIEQRRIGRAKLALQRIGRRSEQNCDALGVLMKSGRGNDEADIIAAASSGASRHLLQFGSGERAPASI
jgi:hypothetical protein